jgi:hypothetical protein
LYAIFAEGLACRPMNLLAECGTVPEQPGVTGCMENSGSTLAMIFGALAFMRFGWRLSW